MLAALMLAALMLATQILATQILAALTLASRMVTRLAWLSEQEALRGREAPPTSRGGHQPVTPRLRLSV